MNSTFLFNDKIHDLLSRIEVYLSLSSTTNPTITNTSHLYSLSYNPQNNNHIDAKLPKIERPNFNSKPIEWQSFWDQFSAAVDSKRIYPTLLNFLI